MAFTKSASKIQKRIGRTSFFIEKINFMNKKFIIPAAQHKIEQKLFLKGRNIMLKNLF